MAFRSDLERVSLYGGVVTAFEKGSFKLDSKLAERARPGRIRCPHCKWRPGRKSLWTCMPAGAPEHFSGGCGRSWNTFDTKGLCPGCSYRWRHTMCLQCGQWALHGDWYEPEGRGGGNGGP